MKHVDNTPSAPLNGELCKLIVPGFDMNRRHTARYGSVRAEVYRSYLLGQRFRACLVWEFAFLRGEGANFK